MRRKPSKRRAIASVLAILMLAVLFTLALSFAGLSNQNTLQAANLARAEVARLQAESGLSFVVQKLANVPVSAGASGSTLLNAITSSLASQLNGTPNLQGALVTSGGGVVTIPSIRTDADGRSFSAAITVDGNAVRVQVHGAHGTITRAVRISCQPRSTHNPVFDFGLAAKGPIELIGNSRLRGANNRAEASLLTTASGPGNELTLNGNCTIDGDASLGPPDGNASMIGNISIGGASGAAAWSHINLGAGSPEFPTVDPTAFIGAVPAWTDVTSSTSTNGNLTFTNIRIRAGTNPTFSGNITIKGVVYVETPNVVRFTGNLNFTGVVVTQDAGRGHTATNAIRFTGNTTLAGVESLPDTSDFHTLRTMPGSALLAPGFEVEYLGNFGTVNGTMAAEKFTWTGNAGGTIYGGIISYGPDKMSLGGNSLITVNRSRYTSDPLGFASSTKLVPDMDSYEE